MKRDDFLAGSLLAIVGIGVVIGAVQLRIGTPLHPQPGFFPLLGGSALTLLAVILLFQAALGRSTGSEAFGKVGPPAIMVVGMCVYVAILEPAGYVPATILISGVILRVLGVRSWRDARRDQPGPIGRHVCPVRPAPGNRPSGRRPGISRLGVRAWRP